MAVSSIKVASNANDFNLSLGGASTSVTLSKEYPAGAYTLSSNDTSLDVYAYNSDGSTAGYTSTKSFVATKGFNKLVILGGVTGDVLTFTFKQTFETTVDSDEVTAGAFVTSSSPSALPNLDDVLTINGGNFSENLQVHFINQAGTVIDAKAIVRESSTELSVTRPDAFFTTDGPYSVRVVNVGVPSPVGSNANVLSNAVTAGALPVWQTQTPLTAMSVGFAYSQTVTATDPEETTISYSHVGGTFPTGITFDEETNTISGTNTSGTSETTTYSVTIRATDTGGNFVDRTFQIPTNLAPAWTTSAGSLPAAIQNVNYSTQLATNSGTYGGTVTYAVQSGSLPSGLVLSSSGAITGSSAGTVGDTATFTVRATDSLGAYSDREFSILTDAVGQQLFTSTGSWSVPAGVTSVSIVAVGGGGGGAATTSSAGGKAGGGGGGGALHYRNSISVTPGEILSIGVGAAGTGGTAPGSSNNTAGGESFVKRSGTYLVQAGGGEAGKYNLLNTALGGVPNLELGGSGANGGRGGSGTDGLGVYPIWVQNGGNAEANIASTGSQTSLTLPANTTFTIKGGKGGGGGGGFGSTVSGTINTAGTYIVAVGGAGGTGSNAAGGYNGGATAGGGRGDEGAGGGATDIRRSADATLNGRIAIAAGGGGQGGFSGGSGGGGGAIGGNGSNGTSGQGQGGSAGTQTSGGNGGYPNGGSWGDSGGLGVGGNGGNSYVSGGGGGGGGYYGGGGGGADIDTCCSNAGGGGGGSSYIHPTYVSNSSSTAANNNGAGTAFFSYAGSIPDQSDLTPGGGGGGAAGYSGNGGDGSSSSTYIATAGSGGGGSGATGSNGLSGALTLTGGGVGLLGEGTSGSAPSQIANQPGSAGSGGSTKLYGAGGSGSDDDSSSSAADGGQGAVRIIWGNGRAFPNTLTGNM